MGEVVPFPSRAKPRPVEQPATLPAWLEMTMTTTGQTRAQVEAGMRRLDDWLDKVLGKETR